MFTKALQGDEKKNRRVVAFDVIQPPRWLGDYKVTNTYGDEKYKLTSTGYCCGSIAPLGDYNTDRPTGR